MNDNKSYRLAEYILREADEYIISGECGVKTRERVLASLTELLIGLHSEFRPGIDKAYDSQQASDALKEIIGGAV